MNFKNSLILLFLILLVLGYLPLAAQNSLVLNGGTVSLYNGAKLVIDNPAPSGIQTISGNILSEDEYNQIIWHIGNSSGTYILPWGNFSGSLFPMPMNVFAGAVGVNGYMEFSTYGTTPNNLPLPSMVTHVNNNYTGADNSLYTIDRFWIINAKNYTTKPSVLLNFSYLDNELMAPNTIIEANLQAQRFNSALNVWGDWGPFGLGTPLVNTVSGASLTISPNDFFEAWTLVDNTQPLPIELLTLYGECKIDYNEIKWSTASETNNAFFNLYKSSNGKEFNLVHSEPGAINSTRTNDYVFKDFQINQNLIYLYYLEQIDLDGNTNSYKPFEVLPCKLSKSNTTVFYSNGNITIQNSSDNYFNLTVTIYNDLGQAISSNVWNLKIDGKQLELPVLLGKGVYFVSIFNGSVNESHKVLIN